jgi:hypothetical protein
MNTISAQLFKISVIAIGSLILSVQYETGDLKRDWKRIAHPYVFWTVQAIE